MAPFCRSSMILRYLQMATWMFTSKTPMAQKPCKLSTLNYTVQGQATIPAVMLSLCPAGSGRDR